MVVTLIPAKIYKSLEFQANQNSKTLSLKKGSVSFCWTCSVVLAEINEMALKGVPCGSPHVFSEGSNTPQGCQGWMDSTKFGPSPDPLLPYRTFSPVLGSLATSFGSRANDCSKSVQVTPVTHSIRSCNHIPSVAVHVGSPRPLCSAGRYCS